MIFPILSTFSVVARDPENGDLGIIVQSKFPAVGSIVPWARAEIGAVATQAWANASYGPVGLDLLEKGMSAPEVLKSLLEADEMAEHRQVGIVDSSGRVAAHTGDLCMDWAGHIAGKGYICQGNILAGESVIADMVSAYEFTQGDLVARLFAALKAGQAAGGDRRGMQSAAILVVRKKGGYEGRNDRYVDVRVDDHPAPIDELERVFRLYDMTLLSREDPSQLLTIDGDIGWMIQNALFKLGYIEDVSSDSFPSSAKDALQEWININNFENKWRDDGTIWRSILNYLLNDAEGH
ncbi:MAG: DUF1028 domain-containing protein [Candidatus Thorarchaeota archaeon]|nr:DUF1028 domain-containing protein [Candidatus Thorarchaeota archaeon]